MSGDSFTLSITILLTGFAVVFFVLLVLIGIIKLYGTIIYSIQKKRTESKTVIPKGKIAREDISAPQPEVQIQTDDDELIAVISAAVYSVYSPSQVRIKSIRKRTERSGAWRSAGLSDSVRPF